MLNIFIAVLLSIFGLRLQWRVVSFDPTDSDSPIVLEEVANERWWWLAMQTSTAVVDDDGVRHEFAHLTFARIVKADAA